MRTWQAEVWGNVTRSLVFILCLFLFQLFAIYFHYLNYYYLTIILRGRAGYEMIYITNEARSLVSSKPE